MGNESKFKNWCIVELFGHSKIAGYCTEENIAGSNMLRVDVSETKSQPAFTKYYGSAAIYAINPVDEKTARISAESLEVGFINVWQGEEFSKKFVSNKESTARMLENINNDDDESYPTRDDMDDDDERSF